MAKCERCGRSRPEYANVALRGREVSLCSSRCLALWARALAAMSNVERPEGMPLDYKQIERMVRRG